MREAWQGCEHRLSLTAISEELSHCLIAGIVASYTRSFTGNDGISAVAGFENFLDSQMQDLHLEIMKFRDKVYAHKSRVFE